MSVPRFTDFQAFPLKRVMLTRAPGFMFSPENVELLVKETGLVQAQVQKWAENFRKRYATENARMEYLTTEGCEKVT
jgi:hypothetical protein